MAGARLGLRLACAAVVVGMLVSGASLAGWGFDVLERLPDSSICWARWLFDLPCPGCGMLRGLLSLGQLRFGDAIGLHPLSLPCALAIVWIASGSPGRSQLRAIPQATHTRITALAIGLVVGIWALRIASGSAI